MPNVTVTGPDGTKYTVNAPKGASDAQIMKFVQERVTKSRKAEEPTTAENFHGALSSFLDGAIPGAGGVLSGAAGAIMNPSDMKKGFKEYRKASEQHEERFKQKHPYLAGAATGAGFVGSLFVPVTKIGLAAKGAEALGQAAKVGLGGRVLNSAANGAIMGAASGAMESHADSAGGVLRDTARGGVLGGAVAGALPVAGRLAAPMVQPLAAAASRRVAPAVAGIARSLPVPPPMARRLQNRADMMARPAADANANRHIGAALDEAEMDPAALMAEMQRRHSMGVPAAPADTSEGLRGTFAVAARQPGPALTSVRRHIDNRQREMTQRVSGHVGETLGPITNVEQQKAILRQQAEEAARPLYDISDAQPIPLVNELRELFATPSGREAMQTAGRELQDRRAPLSEMGLVQGPDEVFELGQAPTMPFYDHMKSVLDEGVFNGEGFNASDTAGRFGKGARQIRKDLLNIMDGDGSGPRIPGQPGTDLAAVSQAPQASPELTEQLARLPSPPPRQALSEGLPVPYEAPMDQGRRLYPEAPQAAPEEPLGSAIPENGLNPYWKAAREAYAGPTQNRKALELGQDMAKDNAVDAFNRMENMTAGSQRDFFRLGHRTGIAQDVRNLGDYGNAARRVDGNVDARDAISYVHGEEPSQALFDRLAAEHEGYQTWAAVRGNPRAGREADQIAEQEQALADTGRGVWAAAQGRGMDAVRHFSTAFSGEPALTGPVNERIAQKLGSTDLGDIRTMLGDVRRGRVADNAAANRAEMSTSQASKVIGSRTGAGAATPDERQLLGYRENPDGSFKAVYGFPGTVSDGSYIPAGL